MQITEKVRMHRRRIGAMDTSGGGERVAAFFDLDGVLFHSDAEWIISDTDILDEIGMRLTPDERKRHRVSQERGAHMAKLLPDDVDINDVFDFSEFESEKAFKKQATTGSTIPGLMKTIVRHKKRGHYVFILTARRNYEAIQGVFGGEIGKSLKQLDMANPFVNKGSVYAVNDRKFISFWNRVGISRSADKKAAVIQSWLKYLPGEQPFDDIPEEQRKGFMKWREKHAEKLFDMIYFYDDEMPNIASVEKMVRKEADKLPFGKDTVVANFVVGNGIMEQKKGTLIDKIDRNKLEALRGKQEITEMARKGEHIKVDGKRGTFEVQDGRKRLATNVNTGKEIQYANADVTVVPKKKATKKVAKKATKKIAKKATKKVAKKATKKVVKKSDSAKFLPNKLRPTSFVSAYFGLSGGKSTVVKGPDEEQPDVTKRESGDLKLDSRSQFAKRTLRDLDEKGIDKESRMYKIVSMAANNPKKFEASVSKSKGYRHFSDKKAVSENVDRLYEKMREASQYEGGLTMFMEKITEVDKSADLHENMRSALKVLISEGVISENILEEI